MQSHTDTQQISHALDIQTLKASPTHTIMLSSHGKNINSQPTVVALRINLLVSRDSGNMRRVTGQVEDVTVTCNIVFWRITHSSNKVDTRLITRIKIIK